MSGTHNPIPKKLQNSPILKWAEILNIFQKINTGMLSKYVESFLTSLAIRKMQI